MRKTQDSYDVSCWILCCVDLMLVKHVCLCFTLSDWNKYCTGVLECITERSASDFYYN